MGTDNNVSNVGAPASAVAQPGLLDDLRACGGGIVIAKNAGTIATKRVTMRRTHG